MNILFDRLGFVFYRRCIFIFVTISYSNIFFPTKYLVFTSSKPNLRIKPSRQGLELAGSTSTCTYHWQTNDPAGEEGSLLKGMDCRDVLLISPRLSAAGDALNVTMMSRFTMRRTSKLTQEHRDGEPIILVFMVDGWRVLKFWRLRRWSTTLRSSWWTVDVFNGYGFSPMRESCL